MSSGVLPLAQRASRTSAACGHGRTRCRPCWPDWRISPPTARACAAAAAPVSSASEKPIARAFSSSSARASFLLAVFKSRNRLCHLRLQVFQLFQRKSVQIHVPCACPPLMMLPVRVNRTNCRIGAIIDSLFRAALGQNALQACGDACSAAARFPRHCGRTFHRRAGYVPSARGRPTSDFPAAAGSASPCASSALVTSLASAGFDR